MTTTYPPPPRSNGLGIAGFIVSLVGLIFTCGILCPIGLLLSFFAIFRSPRGFAAAGLVLGLIGSIIPLAFLAIFGMAIVGAAKFGKPGIATLVAVGESEKEIENATARTSTLPDNTDGNALIASKPDGWGHALRYTRRSASSYELRSAGPDGVFDTSDDLPADYTISTTTRPE